MKTRTNTAISSDPRKAGKRRFYAFTFFNVISFSFIGVDILTLYSVRLEASNFFIGIISSFFFMSFFFTLIGRKLIKRMGAVRVFGRFWVIRYALMVPVAITALPLIRDIRTLVFFLIGIGCFGFNVSRGIAIAAHPPVLGEIARDRDRGSFLARSQLIIHLMRIVTGVSMAMLLGKNSRLFMYTVFIVLGILTGLVAAKNIFAIPEPKEAGRGYSTNMKENVIDALSLPHFRHLLVTSGLIVFIASIATPFLVVFFKKVYGHLDSTVVLFTVAGAIGAASMALITGFFADRIGPKPLQFAFSIVTIMALTPILFHPGSSGGVFLYLFPIILYFFFQMGLFGTMNASDTYFFATTPPDLRLDRGIILSLTKGVGGFIGGVLGGAYISILEDLLAGNQIAVFQIFFATVIASVVVVAILTMRLPDSGSFALQDAIGIMFSPRDFQAIRLLNRLDKAQTDWEEQRTVEALGSLGSKLPISELHVRLRSPSLFVRTEALRALRMSPLNPETTDLLIHEINEHHFTTAHLGAEIAGDLRIYKAIPVLRETLHSEDYLLCSKAMVALAQLEDRRSLAHIIEIFSHTTNPRMTIYGAKSIELFGDSKGLNPLLTKLETADYPFVRDDIIVSIAGLLGLYEWFYGIYSLYLNEPAEAITTLRTMLGTTNDWGKRDALIETIEDAWDEFPSRATEAAANVTFTVGGTDVTDTVVGSFTRPDLVRHRRFRFLSVAAILWNGRSPEASGFTVSG